MAHQSLSPALPREVTPDLRSLAETVWRLVYRDSSHAALHMVSRALRDIEERSHDERRAYLLNLRGIVYAQQKREPEALADLTTATTVCSSWHIPWFNLGLCHKRARRWREASQALRRAAALCRAPSQGLHWNLGIVHTALAEWGAARAAWQACGFACAPAAGVPELDLGLAQLSLPTKGVYAAERVWVQRLDPARARILSVVRYGAPCQFGDVVLCDGGEGQSGFCDGVVASDGQDGGETRADGGEARDGTMAFLDVLESAGYALHVVRGDPATPAQATTLTERLRDSELHIEVWSLTMRLPDDNPAAPPGGAVPFCAGLVLPTLLADPQGVAQRAVEEITAAAREVGLGLYAPTLMAAAGDEVGAARHRKAIKLKFS